jgi:hypothetical protein
MKAAAKSTPQSDLVALSGATTVTFPHDVVAEGEEAGGDQGQHEAHGAEVERPRRLPHEQGAAEDDGDGREDERGPQRLVEENDGEAAREERRGGRRPLGAGGEAALPPPLRHAQAGVLTRSGTLSR